MLKWNNRKVVFVERGPLLNPLAASTDISKAVRAAYGSNEEYTALADRCIPMWREWNNKFGTQLYHETGVLFVCERPMQPGDFEFESARVLEERRHGFERFDREKFHRRFPAVVPLRFRGAFLEPE